MISEERTKSQQKEKSDAGKAKPAKVMDTKPVTKLKQPPTVELKPDVKLVPKSSKKQLPADVSNAKTKSSKEAVKPALAKAPTVAAKLPDKKSTAKKVVAVPKKQAAKILTDEVKNING